jgi:hypothetical protein
MICQQQAIVISAMSHLFPVVHSCFSGRDVKVIPASLPNEIDKQFAHCVKDSSWVDAWTDRQYISRMIDKDTEPGGLPSIS